MNISAVDNDQIYNAEKKIETQTSQIAALKNKSGGGSSGEKRGKYHGNFPIKILKKFKDCKTLNKKEQHMLTRLR